MCGSVGMFVGCAALSMCPRKLLGGPTRPDEADPGAAASLAGVSYREPFQGWEHRASVRMSPRRVFTPADAAAPPIAAELVPVAAHPQVRALPPEAFRTVLLQHLYRYLHFTVALESLVVNRTVLGIANGSVGVTLPARMRSDAYKLYCDEAYHAMFSADLLQQVEEVTGRPPRLPRKPYFLTRLEALLAEVEPAARPLTELLFVVVSETLISATLAEQSGGAEMASSVRDAIRDHAVDEGRHHAYFVSFLRHLWPQLSTAERAFAGRLVPRLISVFLDPDVAGVRDDLLECGMPAATVDDVVAECFAPARLLEQQRAMARQTLQYFTEVGAFDGGGA